MNKKQFNILGIAAILIIGKLVGGLHVAIQFDAWDMFFQKTLDALPFYLSVMIVAALLIYVFKGNRPKQQKHP